MTVNLLGMELCKAENLLSALNSQYTVSYYYAKKPLEGTDSARVIRQTEENGCIHLLVSAFKTKID